MQLRSLAGTTRAKGRALALVLVMLTILTSCVTATAGADPRFHGGRVYVASDACSGQQYRPASIVLACGDGGLWATNIRYQRYGGKTAFATAVLHAHSCVPDCAQSAFHSFPGTLLLHAIVRCEGVLFYSRATYRFVNGAPYGGAATGTGFVEPFGEEGERICGGVLG